MKSVRWWRLPYGESPEIRAFVREHASSKLTPKQLFEEARARRINVWRAVFLVIAARDRTQLFKQLGRENEDYIDIALVDEMERVDERDDEPLHPDDMDDDEWFRWAVDQLTEYYP